MFMWIEGGMEMEILCDYIDSIQSSLKSFREAVSA